MSKETEQQNHMPRSQKRKMYKQYGVLDKKNKNTLEEAWVISTVKDKETYRSDKKEAKRLRKEANELHTKRLNANNNS